MASTCLHFASLFLLLSLSASSLFFVAARPAPRAGNTPSVPVSLPLPPIKTLAEVLFNNTYNAYGSKDATFLHSFFSDQATLDVSGSPGLTDPSLIEDAIDAAISILTSADDYRLHDPVVIYTDWIHNTSSSSPSSSADLPLTLYLYGEFALDVSMAIFGFNLAVESMQVWQTDSVTMQWKIIKAAVTVRLLSEQAVFNSSHSKHMRALTKAFRADIAMQVNANNEEREVIIREKEAARTSVNAKDIDPVILQRVENATQVWFAAVNRHDSKTLAQLYADDSIMNFDVFGHAYGPSGISSEYEALWSTACVLANLTASSLTVLEAGFNRDDGYYYSRHNVTLSFNWTPSSSSSSPSADAAAPFSFPRSPLLGLNTVAAEFMVIWQVEVQEVKIVVHMITFDSETF